MTSADLNYPKELIAICQGLVFKDKKDAQAAYKIHRDAILEATTNFPSNIRIDKRITAIRKNISCVCKQCGTCHGDYKKPTYCSQECYTTSRQKDSIENDKAKVLKKIQKSIEKHNGIEDEDYVECKICGLRTFGSLNFHLTSQHDTTAIEYKEKFNSKLSPSKQGFQKGEANIAFNHGGKFSPWSDKFVNPNNIDIEECKTRTQQAIIDSDKLNTRLSFYLNQGMSETEAKIALSERQSTFSLQKCVEKYGETEGINIFNTRQEKWQKTLSDKPADEIDKMNRKKATKVNYKSLWNNELHIDGEFYIIELPNNNVKIGITSRDVHKRYTKLELDGCNVLCTRKMPINHCFMLEQLTVRHLNNFKISKNEQYMQYGWTETFTECPNKILEYVLSKSENDIEKEFNENFKPR